MIKKQTTLDLNGPVLSFSLQPVSISTCNAGIAATYVGVVTSYFPQQDPPNPASGTGQISYRWYIDGYGALSDDIILGSRIAGSATTTLTIYSPKSPTISGSQVYLSADYIPSAYVEPSTSPVTPLTERSTGNSVIDPLTSNKVSLTVYPTISFSSHPTNKSVLSGSESSFLVSIQNSDDSIGDVTYQWEIDGVPVNNTNFVANYYVPSTEKYVTVYDELEKSTEIVKLSEVVSYSNFVTGREYTITPNEDIEVDVYAVGGGGGEETYRGSQGGRGGFASGTLTLIKDQQYKVVVGGGAINSTGGYGGGGNGSTGGAGGVSGGGGGYTGLFLNSVDHSNALLIAGGGGGAANGPSQGGDGGGLRGGDASNISRYVRVEVPKPKKFNLVDREVYPFNLFDFPLPMIELGSVFVPANGGFGGTQSEGGEGTSKGDKLLGGSGSAAGGGGGYYGGGGGTFSSGCCLDGAGGGGSGHINSSIVFEGSYDFQTESDGGGKCGNDGTFKIFFKLPKESGSIIVSGFNTPDLKISSNEVGIFPVRCKVTNSLSCDDPIYSKTASFNSAAPKNIINFEYIDVIGTSNADLNSIDLDSSDCITLTGDNTNGKLISFYAPEKDIEVTFDIYASKGLDSGNYVGGQGGTSVLNYTLKKNTEYVIAPLPFSDSNGGVYLYEKSKLLAAVGSGGNAGPSGNGGSGGGANISGLNGSGRGSGNGAQTVPTGTLQSSGYFPGYWTGGVVSTDVINSNISGGGRTITCPRGDYWRTQGYSPCQDIGKQYLVRADGSTVANTSNEIDRGFKSGYCIRQTSGRGQNNGGNGGFGVIGGDGGSDGAGGGGGSGYSDGVIEVVSATQGGNTGICRVAICLQSSGYYIDSFGRILILSVATPGKDPSTLVKTTGKVLPGSDSCIDDARWQEFIRLAGLIDGYRLTTTLDNSNVRIINASDNNIRRMSNSNYVRLKSSLTDWQTIPYAYELKCLAWDENSIDPGFGSDYSILSWSPQNAYGFGYYGGSSNPFFNGSTYSHFTANFWVLPPGVPDFS